MEISPKYTDVNWRTLGLSIDSPQTKWKEAVEIFHDRIDGRFLKFVRQIEDNGFAGFVVMAVDCLLIETLKQFFEGEKETPRNKSINSKEYFVQFLTKTSFGRDFETRKMAETFYYKIRNGILHQAEIKDSSRITIKDTAELARYTDDKNGLVINRKKFHKQLMQEFESYKAKLIDPSQDVLRQNFIKKMNHICQVAGETN